MKKREIKVAEWVIPVLSTLALIWWCLALWSMNSASIYEWVIDKQQDIIRQLRQVDREKCIDLFVKDEI